MMLYRPFLHYISPRTATGRVVDERYYACAANGISVSRNILHIAMEIKNQAMVVGPFWSMIYTEFFAILTLVFYVLESPDKEGSAEIFADANAGREMIAKLAGRSYAADRISRSMDTLWMNLPESIKNLKFQNRASKSKKRSAPGINPGPAPSSTKNSAAKCDTLRKPTNQRSSLENLQQTSPQSIMSLNYPELHALDIPSTSSETSGVATPTTAHPSAANAYLRTSSSHAQESPIYKLDALMFPSGDPFAYPDQPLDFGTNVSAAHTESTQPALMANVHSHPTDPRNYYVPGLYGDIEGQLSKLLPRTRRFHGNLANQTTVGPVPPYLMQSNHTVQNGLGLSTQMYQASNAMAMQQAQVQHHQQQHAQHQRRREMDDLMADSGFNRTWDIFSGPFKPL